MTSAVSGYPLIVIGMHRSGTSFLTGTLQLAGLDLGQHSTANTHNRKGNRENPDIVAFHDAVLAARGHAWNQPPAGPVTWTAAERATATGLVTAFDRRGPWGFKDPRALLMTGAWCDLCPGARFVGIFRHPTAVFRSLRSRSDRMTVEKAEMLWTAYNRRLVALYDERPFPLFSFDEDEAALHDKINAVLPGLGLRPPVPDPAADSGTEVFFSADLRHHADAPETVPAHLADLYAALKARQC